MATVQIKDDAGVTDRARRLCTMAVLRTWARTRLPYPLRFKVRLVCGFKGNVTAEFNPDTDTMILDVDALGRNFKTLHVKDSLALCVAHETTHRAQFVRGEKPTPSYRNWRYNDCPFEDEAWREAIITFKELYPRASGWLDVSGKRYDL